MAEFTRARRDQVLDRAIAAGKFPASRRAEYARLYDAQPEATERFIESLASTQPAEALHDGYPDAWLAPSERAGVVAASASRQDPHPPRVAAGQPPAPSAAPTRAAGESYPPGWLSDGERARVRATREGRQFGRIVTEQ